MKSLSMFNKPVSNADNKQGGVFFLEYVIMAFIITTAVFCATYWLYYHLQQMIWELKSRLDRMQNLRYCPTRPIGEQPTPTIPG